MMGASNSLESSLSSDHIPDSSLSHSSTASYSINSDTSNLSSFNQPNHDTMLGFHDVCGTNISLEKNACTAKRIQGFCKSIALSNRPIHTNERIYVRFLQVINCWSGLLRFGFTTLDPSAAKNKEEILEARYICPDLTNKNGYWAKALVDAVGENDVLYFYVNDFGEVHYGINHTYKGVFFRDLKLSSHLRQNIWAIFDVYGKTTRIEILDARKMTMQGQFGNDEASLESQHDTDEVDSLIDQFRRLCDNDLNESMSTSEFAFFKTPYKLHPILYHADQETNFKFNSTLMGSNVHLNEDKRIAYRKLSLELRRNAYVFIDKPMEVNSSICVQILNIDLRSNGTNEALNTDNSIAFGCTNCDLRSLKAKDLPSDSYDLLNRSEYWIVNKNILNNASIADELCFTLDREGNVSYKVNGKSRTRCLFNVDLSQKLTFFFDVCGKTTAIKLLKSCSMLQNSDRNQPAAQHTRKSSIRNSNSFLSNLTSQSTNRAIVSEECRICLDAPMDCVIYSCGHLCLCWTCATAITKDKSKKAFCPICREEIKDVIRVYKS